MKLVLWLGAFALMFGRVSGAEDLKPGIWMLDIYNPRAPLETIQLRIEAVDATYTAAEMGGGRQQIDNFRLVDDELLFDHLLLEEGCLLRFDEGSGVWQGTCPPNEKLKFDGGLTVWLRAPKGESTTSGDESENPIATADVEPEVEEEDGSED